MSLVIDSSMTLAWYFEDERTEANIAVLRQVAETGTVVPALWRLEVLNGFQMAVRRGRIDTAYRDESLARLEFAGDFDRSGYEPASLVGHIAAVRPVWPHLL